MSKKTLLSSGLAPFNIAQVLYYHDIPKDEVRPCIIEFHTYTVTSSWTVYIKSPDGLQLHPRPIKMAQLYPRPEKYRYVSSFEYTPPPQVMDDSKKPWVCKHCSFENQTLYISIKKPNDCEMCGLPRSTPRQVSSFEDTPPPQVKVDSKKTWVCEHCSFENQTLYIPHGCEICGLPRTGRSKPRHARPRVGFISAASGFNLDSPRQSPTEDKHLEKINILRARVLHLADVVTERITAFDFTSPEEFHARLLASELDLQEQWRELQRHDSEARSWLDSSYARDIVMNPQAAPVSPAPQRGDEEEEKSQESNTTEISLTRQLASLGLNLAPEKEDKRPSS